MKAIHILESQLAELVAIRVRLAEKGLDSAVLGLNQAVRDARAALNGAHDSAQIEAEYCVAIERNGTFVVALPLQAAKTLAGAKRAALESGFKDKFDALVIFRDGAPVCRKEGSRWCALRS